MTKNNVKIHRPSGFTLIELMIVVAIVAILAVLVVPSYQEHVNRAKRAEGRAFLLDIASRQERFYTQYSSYTATIAKPVCSGGAGCGLGLLADTSPEERYTASVAVTPSSCSPNGTAGAVLCTGYTLTVTPAWTDDNCGDLTLTHTQIKGATGSKGVDYCWR